MRCNPRSERLRKTYRSWLVCSDGLSGNAQQKLPKAPHQGKKTLFDWRLNTPDRLGKAGVNKIGLGCLFGLTADYAIDALFAGMHLDYLEKSYWKTSYSMAFPRIRPYEGENIVAANLSDKDLVQLYCAFRIFNHELELTLSTRESPNLRENLLPLGVTTMSAGSKTNPGGYASGMNLLSSSKFLTKEHPSKLHRC